jgi:peptidoglycan glycosyltransferase
LKKNNRDIRVENSGKKNNRTNAKKKNASNRQMITVTYLFLFVFVAMIIYFVDFQVNDSGEVINNNYNQRQEILSESIVRGSILSSDRQILAQTLVDDEGNETRNYPFGAMFAHSVGFSTHGKTGVELLANYTLLTSNSPITEIVENEFKGDKNIGDNVITSLDVDITQVAYNALGDEQGAIIAIEPSTGKIITMVSKPDFDPNTIDDIYDTLVSDASNSNLLNRATSGLYTPGSTFKIFTLLEYIRENPDYNNYSYNCRGSITVDDNTISCASGKWHRNEDLTDSFANSCNSSFVNIGLTLNKTKFKNLCNSLLFNSDLPLTMSYKSSEFVLNEESTDFETMQTVMGQGKTLVTPIHLALVAAAIANDGVLMKPYIITSVENYLGTTIKTYSPEKAQTLLSSSEASILKEFMRAVVTNGTGTKLNSDLYTAYGKTGTAQINDGSQSNSLFMGYAEKDGKKLAICVVLEDMPEGSTPAVPVAKQVFDAYFK